MSLTDEDRYRLVPHRFRINEAETDMCKLEKLTNLFPDMKEIIALELFKMNNLTRMINRLSNIYKVENAIDTRDDTLHLFLGPYHLSVGPAIYGALHFRNVSTALLALSHSKTSGDNTNKRRHEAVLRRFRRAVRKLIHIKSIINQLRLASILTPYNQYELYTRGVYDLVLAGQIHDSHSVFNNDNFIKQIDDIRSMNNFEKENSLLGSQFVKINTLLHLLSPVPSQSDNNLTPGIISPVRSEDTNTYTKNETSSKSFINSSTMCCAQHSQNIPLVVFPINRSASYQSMQFLPPESRSRRNSKQTANRNSSVLPKQIAANSLPDLTTRDNFSTKIPSNSITHKSDESEKLAVPQSHVLSSRLKTNQEDAFINRISSLLTNYILTQQSTAIPSDTYNNHEKLADSTDSLSSITNPMGSNNSDISNQFSSIIDIKEFDKLLQRIKIVVDNNLSDDQNVYHRKTTATNGHRRQLLKSRTTSYQEIPTDEFNKKHSKSTTDKQKLHLRSKSQSSLKFSSQQPKSNDNSVEF